MSNPPPTSPADVAYTTAEISDVAFTTKKQKTDVKATAGTPVERRAPVAPAGAAAAKARLQLLLLKEELDVKYLLLQEELSLERWGPALSRRPRRRHERARRGSQQQQQQQHDHPRGDQARPFGRRPQAARRAGGSQQVSPRGSCSGVERQVSPYPLSPPYSSVPNNPIPPATSIPIPLCPVSPCPSAFSIPIPLPPITPYPAGSSTPIPLPTNIPCLPAPLPRFPKL
nr:developmental and secondary metabolism regulator veA-like [Penaeus vannamei]